ncbi:MAG TPA: integrase core domain-containing protein [Candidatus Dormibacteraeota bacterium]|nr:integrase core domain-containing protein [Candidatus Dormibacteraeota bacterium]
MLASLIYSVLRVVIDLLATSRDDQASLQAEVLVLRRQVQVLERQVKRVNWKPGDRMLMAALRNRLPQSAWAGLLVRPATVLGWHRALVRRKWAAYRDRSRRGRPPISAESRKLILKMAKENPSWGYPRIRGELLKLGYKVAATTIRSVLIAAGVPPSPRRAGLSWRQFLAAHAQTLVAADVFSVDTIVFKRLYVLIYMHLATRRILLAACTSNPNQAWVTQQARNLLWTLEEEGIRLTAVIHDRDKKFAPAADAILRAAGARVILTPLLAPKANAHAERWIGTCRRECLDWMLVVNLSHLEAIVREFCTHYNQQRPHRSCQSRPPAALGDPIAAEPGKVRRRTRLGGLLSEYYREAVAA